MLLAILLQAARFLDPPGALPAPQDAAYEARLAGIVADGALPTSDWLALQPSGPAQEATLRALIRSGDAAALRLAAWIGAGQEPASYIARELVRAACSKRDSAAALAALLALLSLAAGDLPAVAYLALDPGRDLSLRAAAAGRLLETGCGGAWPLARSILRSGTPLDEDAPWADWPRTGRYELPKRLLSRSLSAWLGGSTEPFERYEANASWPRQREQLARLEAAVQERLAGAPGMAAPRSWGGSLDRLLQAAAGGDERAARALTLLRPRADAALQAASEGAQTATRDAARAALESAAR